MDEDLELNSDDIKFCNCAECGRPLVVGAFYSILGGRIKGRPYCWLCLEPRELSSSSIFVQRRATLEDTSPWQDVAIRHLEDG